MINWNPISSEADLEAIKSLSESTPCAIFKHSTRCGISAMVKYNLESSWDIPEEDISLYYLDLLAHRDLSDKIAADYNILHQSPQLLMIKDQQCIFAASHHAIQVDDIKDILVQ